MFLVAFCILKVRKSSEARLFYTVKLFHYLSFLSKPAIFILPCGALPLYMFCM